MRWQHITLLDEPWIPCNMLQDGAWKSLSLTERTGASASRIGEIGGDSPLVVIALHRLLLAVLLPQLQRRERTGVEHPLAE